MVVVRVAEHPGVVDDLLHLYPVVLVDLKQPLDQVPRLLRHVLPVGRVELHPNVEYLASEVHLVVGFEGRVAAEQHVEDHPDGPPINFFVVLFAGQHLGSHVERGAH